MPLKQRLLRANFTLPSGEKVLLDETLHMRMQIRKAALDFQHQCTLEVTNLNSSLREKLLSQFTAWNKQRLISGKMKSGGYVTLDVSAGYDGNETPIYTGQITSCGPTQPPPNIAVRIEAFTRQLDRRNQKSEPAPTKTTLLGYVKWAAGQMELGDNFTCETSYNDAEITNPSVSTYIIGDLLIDIQSIKEVRGKIAAYIDNGWLYVKDINKIVSTAEVVTIDEFIGTPQWTEWGMEAQTLFNPKIILPGGVKLISKMNPSLNKTFVVLCLEYDLNSRDVPFYVKVSGAPPA